MLSTHPHSGNRRNDDKMTEDNKLKSGLVETNQKVEASLLTSIQEHIENHSPKAGVDFLQVKNTLLLSYLIDLTIYLKAKLSGKKPESANLQRLNEMKVVLDKVRGLDKKLRYQIDKLLQAENAATFATAGPAVVNPNAPDDPLQYRPDPKALRVDGDDSSSSDDDDDDNDDKSENSDGNNEGGSEPDDDDDLEAAKRTMQLARESSKKKKTKEEEDNIYRAPRHTAMPYVLDKEDKEAQREKRERRKMRASELAQSLRAQYGDAPEQEDYHGGTEYGKQAQAARRFAERQAERVRYEEDHMQRLTVTRKEKKERKRLMRLEGANLNGIADLGNLVRDASRVIDDNQGGKKDTVASMRSERHATGKRKKEAIDKDGRPLGKRKGAKAKNSYQSALFGGDGGGGKKKKRSKR